MADPGSRQIFLPDDTAPTAGQVHRQPALADTLEGIGRNGADHFYRGAVAEGMVETLQALGGLHTLEDFSSTRGEYVTPTQSSYRGYDLFECPPNGQGIVAQIMLNILDGLPVGGDPLDPERIHFFIEACRLAYATRDSFVGDPQTAAIPTEWMLSSAFAESLRMQIDPGQALPPRPTIQPEHKDTVYITVVDDERNTVSFINSIFHAFGSGITTPRSGVLFHNRGQSFFVRPGHPNTVAPKKRPMHTIIPAMLMKDDRVALSFGVMGGHYQAMGHAYVLSAILDCGLDIQQAIDLPRMFPMPGQKHVEVEKPMSHDLRAALAARGHSLVPARNPIGGGQVVSIDWDTGVLWGASDFRKDGLALGY